MMFKVGDIVQVSTTLKCGDGILAGFVESMKIYKGAKAEIAKVIKLGNRGSVYRLNIDNGVWSWDDSMLIPVPRKNKKLKKKVLQ